MDIFQIQKPEKQIKEKTMVGFITDDPTIELVALSALHLRIGKSALLRRIVKEWVERDALDKKVLISHIADYLYKVWLVHSSGSRTPNKLANAFRRDVRQDLASRKLSDETVNDIITKFDGFKKKGDK